MSTDNGLRTKKQESETEYEYFGIRYGKLTISHHWVDGNRTEEELAGTSAVNYSAWEKDPERYDRMYNWLGSKILIGSDNMTYGEDEDELIMKEATEL